MDAAITQTPRYYYIIQSGKKVTLECSQNMYHFVMYWYRQDPGQGLRLIHYSRSFGSTSKGDATEGYHVSCNKNEHFLVTLKLASTNQTSLYLCASSQYTAMNSQLPSAQIGQP